jgi:menaquinone-dependent protoporphyrinogen oxidase
VCGVKIIPPGARLWIHYKVHGSARSRGTSYNALGDIQDRENLKALIVYGSNTGSTEEIAETIASKLSDRGIKVDLVDLKKEKHSRPEDYDLVIVGSGIKMGKWTTEALNYLKNNEESLSLRPHAIFVSSGFTSDPSRREQCRVDYIDAVLERYPKLKPVSTGLFGGVYNWKRYNFVIKRLVISLLKSMGQTEIDTSKPLDFRDWDMINAWAEELTSLVMKRNQ